MVTSILDWERNESMQCCRDKNKIKYWSRVLQWETYFINEPYGEKQCNAHNNTK